MASAEGGVRGLARSRQFRCGRPATHGAGALTGGELMADTMFIESGMGVDLQGQDATKAATRAIRDAIGRNYLPGVRRMLQSSGGRMLVHVRLGVSPEAGEVDLEAVKASLPHGEVTVEIVP